MPNAWCDYGICSWDVMGGYVSKCQKCVVKSRVSISKKIYPLNENSSNLPSKFRGFLVFEMPFRLVHKRPVGWLETPGR